VTGEVLVCREDFSLLFGMIKPPESVAPSLPLLSSRTIKRLKCRIPPSEISPSGGRNYLDNFQEDGGGARADERKATHEGQFEGFAAFQDSNPQNTP
jgi:hypothetical protein